MSCDPISDRRCWRNSTVALRRDDDPGLSHAHLFTERKLQPGTVQQHVAALRFFYVKTLKRRGLLDDLPQPKRGRKLPTILSPEDGAQLIDAAQNLFHRALLMTRSEANPRLTVVQNWTAGINGGK